MLTQRLRRPLELMPGWSASPLDGFLHKQNLKKTSTFISN
jgi:hypothetical protein